MNKTKIEKEKLILEIILKRRSLEPDGETFSFTYEDFTKYPILNDQIGLNFLFNNIKREDTGIVFVFPEPPKQIQGNRQDLAVDWSFPYYNFYIHIEDLEKLKKYYKSLRNRKKTISGLIESIICVDGFDNKFPLIINKNYEGGETILGNKAKSSWKLLFDVANKEVIQYDKKLKNNIDYFNINENNKLYTQTGYQPQKILKIEGGYIVPANIQITVISKKAFERRKKR